jgi:hypothetical protein
MVDKRNIYRGLVRKTEGQKLPAILGFSCEDNIKMGF